MNRILLAVLLVTALVPAATATTPPPCSAVTDEDAQKVQDRYVRENGAQVEIWSEANGVDGLQTAACESANGRQKDADTLDARLPADLVPDVGALVALIEDLAGTAINLVNALCTLVFSLTGPTNCQVA